MRHSLVIPMVAALIAAPLAPGAHGADTAGQFQVRGSGLGTCAQFVDAYEARSDQLLLYGGWLDGYLSAVNQYAQDTFSVAPWEATEFLLALVYQNCEQRPEESFFAMANSMVVQLREQRLRERSVRVTAEAGGETVHLFKETLERAQEALAAGGFYQGPADGAYGPATREALERFQRERGIPVTGLPDQVTLWALLRSAPPEAAPATPE